MSDDPPRFAIDDIKPYWLLRFVSEAAHYDIDTFGRGGIGITLALQYYSGDPWVTITFLNNTLKSMSHSQIRRRLLRLEDEGKVTKRRNLSTNADEYSLTHDCAEKYIETLTRWLKWRQRVRQNDQPVET